VKVCPRCQTRYDDASRFCRKDGAELVPDRAVAPEVVARRELLERRIAQEPEDARLLEELGDLFAEVPLYDEALVQYFKALELAPDGDAVRRKVARVYRARGDWGEAVRHLEPLAEAHPADPALLGELAEAYQQAGRKVEASRVLARMAALAPADAALWRRRRDLLEELRREDELPDVYRRLTDLVPEELSNWLALGRRFLAEGAGASTEELTRLEKRLDQALTRDEAPSGQKAARLRLYLAAVRLRLGIAGAPTRGLLADLDPAGLDGAHAALAAESLADLGELALRSGDAEQAMAACTQALRFSDSARARALLSRLHARRAEEFLGQGRFREAVAACDEGLARVPADGALAALRRLGQGRQRRRLLVRLGAALGVVLVVALGFLYVQRRGPFGEESNAADLTASFGTFLKSQDVVSGFRKGEGGREFTFTVGGDKWRVLVEGASVSPTNDDTGSYRGTVQTRWEKNGVPVAGKRAMPPELLKVGLGPRLNDARYNRFRRRWKW
jgi:tetratricopeptide (TPR) repeat protein